MTGATTWHGRRGAVILGPTEHRVARWLADSTRHGRITIPTTSIAATLGLERSEAYRILARLRVLGLFGVENDRGGTAGGRRIWRTSTADDVGALDAGRHREAWSRIVAWARARAARLAAAIEQTRRRTSAPAQLGRSTSQRNGSAPGLPPSASVRSAETFAGMMRSAGLGRLMDQWRVDDGRKRTP